MDSQLIFLLYVVIKYTAYTAWCSVGLGWLVERGSFLAGMGFGFARLLLGVFFGVIIFIVGGMLHLGVPVHPVLMYFAIYAPVRYIEWTILLHLLRGLNAPPASSAWWKQQAWILGGLAISHLADLPLILTSSEGTKDLLPVGRFIC